MATTVNDYGFFSASGLHHTLSGCGRKSTESVSQLPLHEPEFRACEDGNEVYGNRESLPATQARSRYVTVSVNRDSDI